ncbi:MAG TPA: hypothetical protein PLG61_06600, partial [Methanoregulaceae archaeon]|nr:hypothetical protein [Methanoregulaceae archaeon]
YYPTYYPAYYPTYYPAYYPTYYPAYYPAYYPTYYPAYHITDNNSPDYRSHHVPHPHTHYRATAAPYLLRDRDARR